MQHAAATLNHFQVPEREKDDVLAFFTGLRSDVVWPSSVCGAGERRIGRVPLDVPLDGVHAVVRAAHARAAAAEHLTRRSLWCTSGQQR